MLFVHVHQLNTIVTVVYRPPDTGLNEFAPILHMMEEVFQNLPAPLPTITVMGDLNFPASVVTWHVMDGSLYPRVAGPRVGNNKECQGGQVRQQATRLFDLMAKFHLPSKSVCQPETRRFLTWCGPPTQTLSPML